MVCLCTACNLFSYPSDLWLQQPCFLAEQTSKIVRRTGGYDRKDWFYLSFAVQTDPWAPASPAGIWSAQGRGARKNELVQDSHSPHVHSDLFGQQFGLLAGLGYLAPDTTAFPLELHLVRLLPPLKYVAAVKKNWGFARTRGSSFLRRICRRLKHRGSPWRPPMTLAHARPRKHPLKSCPLLSFDENSCKKPLSALCL